MAYGIVYRVLQPLLVVLVHNRQTRRPSTGSTEIPDRNDPAFERRALGAEDLSQGADRGPGRAVQGKKESLEVKQNDDFPSQALEVKAVDSQIHVRRKLVAPCRWELVGAEGSFWKDNTFLILP